MRKEHRIEARLDVQIMVRGGSHHRATLDDMTKTGARTSRVEGLAAGDEVELFVSLPIPMSHRRRFCRLTAQVRWTTETSMGLHFENLPIATRRQVEVGVETLSELAPYLAPDRSAVANAA